MKKRRKGFQTRQRKTKNSMSLQGYSDDSSKLYISFIRRLPHKDCYALGYIDFNSERVYLKERRKMSKHDIDYIYKVLDTFDYYPCSITIKKL